MPPVAVWLAYSVHGNEHSGTEAAIDVIYRLATSTEPEISQLLDQTVVLVDPCQNPDGRARFIHNYRAFVGRAPNPPFSSAGVCNRCAVSHSCIQVLC